MEEETFNNPEYFELVSHITDSEEISDRVLNALAIAFSCAQFDGGHHKMWVIDQMIQCLTGDFYDEWVRIYTAGEPDDEGYDGEEELYEWDTGIAP